MDGFALTLDGIKGWCDRKGIKWLYNEQLKQLAIPRKPNEVAIRVVPRPERNMVTFALIVPAKVPADRHDEVTKACAILNAQSFMGAWVATAAQGELYFRITMPIESAAWNDQGFEWLMSLLIGTFDQVGPALYRIATQGASAETIRQAAIPPKAG